MRSCEGSEFFFQLRGNIQLPTVQKGKRKLVRHSADGPRPEFPAALIAPAGQDQPGSGLLPAVPYSSLTAKTGGTVLGNVSAFAQRCLPYVQCCCSCERWGFLSNLHGQVFYPCLSLSLSLSSFSLCHSLSLPVTCTWQIWQMLINCQLQAQISLSFNSEFTCFSRAGGFLRLGRGKATRRQGSTPGLVQLLSTVLKEPLLSLSISLQNQKQSPKQRQPPAHADATQKRGGGAT